MFLVFFSWVFSLLFSFCFVGRTSHHSLGFFSFSCISSFSCIFSSINILFFVSDKKNIYHHLSYPMFDWLDIA